MCRQWQSRLLSVITEYPALIYLCDLCNKFKEKRKKDKAFNPLQSTFFLKIFHPQTVMASLTSHLKHDYPALEQRPCYGM